MIDLTHDNVTLAAVLYIKRRGRDEHPSGTFDSAGRWEPTDNESQDCCDSIRSPSRAFPYSYMTHCRTVKHVATLLNADEKVVRKRVKELEKHRSELDIIVTKYEQLKPVKFKQFLKTDSIVLYKSRKHLDGTYTVIKMPESTYSSEKLLAYIFCYTGTHENEWSNVRIKFNRSDAEMNFEEVQTFKGTLQRLKEVMVEELL